MVKICCLLLVCLMAVAPCSRAGESPDTAMDHDQRMAWWREAKFGMFIHWGVYADLAGVWKGEPVDGYSEHIFRMKEIPLETYKKEVAAPFNPEKFDAEEWVKLCKRAGMKYLVITSKHHDGFAMWDTNVKGWETYDVVDGTAFKRDPMVELKAACDEHGIHFGFYYSHAQDWSHRYGQRNTWDFNHPTTKGQWFKDPKWAEHRKNSRFYVEEKAIPQLKEILSEKYDPAIIWFDTSSWLPREYLQQILTVARQVADPKVIFNSRSAKGFADYRSTCDRPAEFPPIEGDWEAIPTTNESYGYHKMDKSHKPVIHFVELLSKACARGGNLLMNVGPKGDGTIDEIDVRILEGIGAWLDVNGEAIYGTQRTPLPVHAWGRSTVKGSNLYLHIHDYPADDRLVVGGLKTKINKAWVLADKEKKPLKMETLESGDVVIHLPSGLSEKMVPVIAAACDGAIECDPVRLVAPDQKNRFHVYDGERMGDHLEYGPGKVRDSYVRNWTDSDDYMRWQNRLETPASFKVYVEYDSAGEDGDNTAVVQVGGETFNINIEPGAVNKRFYVGEVSLDKGAGDITVRAGRIESDELFRLRTVILEPLES